MAKETVYNNTLVSGAVDETLTYTRYVKDESSGKSTKELLDEKVNKTDQLGTTQIADKAVTTEKLENESVTTDKLDAASVTTDKVADANITTSKLADSSVETEKINNKAVTTDKLNDGAVDNSKLSPNAVTSDKIKDESIITEKLNDRAVTTEKVEEKAITNTKLGDQSVDGRVVREASLETKHFANESVTTEKVARKSITKDKLADNAVDASQVVDGSIGNAKLSPDSVTTEKIKDGSVTNEKIADNTLVIGKFDPELRKTIQAATGLPEDLNQMIQDVDQSIKQLHEKDTDLQSQIDDKQQQITANDDDISLLQTRSTQMEEAIKGISASGGASQATAVTYENTESGLDSVTAQGAIDELANKNKSQDTEIAKKANSADVDSQIQTEQERVNAELDKKFDKENIAQEFGDSEDKVVSQFALPYRYIQNEEFIFAKVDANDKLLFGIQWDGTPVFGKTSAVEDRLQSQVTLLAEKVATIMGDEDTTNVIDTMNELKKFFANIENTETLASILANLDKTTIKDEEGNVQDTPFRVIENEEFIIAIVDADDRILYGIYRDTGKPYYTQNDMYHISQSEEFLWVILDAANHPLLGIQQDGTCWAAKAQWLDDIKAIKNVLSSIDETLKTFQPKEDGKGLISLDVADSFFYISNDEYIIAVVDAEDRILAGIKYDGHPYFPNHEMYSVITNKEWLHAIIDAEGKVLGGFRADDGHMIVGGIDISTFIANAIIDIADIKERTAHFSTIENDEYLSVETDSEGKVIGYTAPDGSHYLYKVKSETIPTEFFHIEDPEGRTEITTDAEDKILGYRDSEGTRHEHKISANHINLSDDAAKEVNEAFKSAGIKMENPSDFSNDSHIELPIPRIIAQVHLYSPDIPAKYKGQNIKGEIEYNDKDGNYFRKKVTVNAQGDSSLYYPIRNMSIDIDDGCKIKFGDFPSQDSFHLKKYYIDVFRGQCIVGYRLTEQVYKSHPLGKQYPYEYNYANESTTSGLGNIKKDFFSGAKCHPDGFPIWITWINTITNEKKELGVFTWNLKKSKEVYQCDKKKAENIILDGIISDRTLFGGSISWNSFEVRNPKSLKDIDENKYDGDNPKELSNTDSLSKKTKEFILRLSSVNQQLEASKTKETFESFFLVAPFIDYLLVSYILFHYDGFEKNWIWVTYDGLKWAPTLYDMDSIFGNNVRGTGIVEKSDTELLPEEVDNHNQYCLQVLKELYSTEIESRYKELRDKKIFDIDNIYGLLSNWLQKIGLDNLAKDLEIFKETPSYRDGSIEYTEMPTTGGFFNSPKRVYNWLNNRILFLDSKFNYKK